MLVCIKFCKCNHHLTSAVLASAAGNNLLHKSQQVFASQFALYNRQSCVCSPGICTVSLATSESDKHLFIFINSILGEHVLTMVTDCVASQLF